MTHHRRSLVLAIALAASMTLPAASVLFGVAPASGTTAVVAGYAPGAREEAKTLLASAGATVVDGFDALDALVATTPLGIASLGTLVSPTGTIRYVEPTTRRASPARSGTGRSGTRPSGMARSGMAASALAA